MRIFINNVDTYIGYALCAGLRRFNGVTNRLFGTVQQQSNTEDVKEASTVASATAGHSICTSEDTGEDPDSCGSRLVPPAFMRRLICKRNPQQLLKNLVSCSLIVYDLHTADPEEVESIVRKLKHSSIEKPLVFVLISSTMVWAKSRVEMVQHDSDEELEDNQTEGEGGNEGEEAASSHGNAANRGGQDDTAEDSVHLSEDSDEAELLEEEEEEEPLLVPNRFTAINSISRAKKSNVGPVKRAVKPRRLRGYDKERRIPASRYQRWKTVETLVMSLDSKENITTYVICAGLLYGNGEGPLYQAFKAAWLGLDSHRVIGPGNNWIPTVHVRDVVNLVKRLSTAASEELYHLAVDESNVTQYDLIQTIVNSVGLPYIVSQVTPEQAMLVEEAELLTVDLRLVPSSEMTKDDFAWHSQKGLCENIEMVAKEFCTHRNLKQVKVLISGPPGSGKTLLSNLISTKLNLCPLRTLEVVEESLARSDDLGVLLKKRWSQLLEEQKKKKKMQAAAAAGRNFMSSSNNKKVRFDLETMTRIYSAKLQQNVCRFRGFVLDGYPKTYEAAAALFLRPKNNGKNAEGKDDDSNSAGGDEEDELQDAKSKEMELDPLKTPDYIIILKASEGQCEQRLMSLPQSQIIPGHNDREGFLRRLLQHNLANESEKGEPSVADFFQERQREVLYLDVDGKSADDILEISRIYLEKDGRFFNFLKSERQSLLEREREQQQIAEQERKRQLEEEEEKRVAEKKLVEERRKRDNERLQRIAQHEKEVVLARSIPLRRYLMQSVVPALSEGLLQVCRVMPEDPVDYLAEFLMVEAYKNSNSLTADL